MSFTLDSFQEDLCVNKQPQEHAFQGSDNCKSSFSSLQNKVADNLEFTNLNSHHSNIQQDFNQNTDLSNSDLRPDLDFLQLNLQQDFGYGHFIGANETKQSEPNAIPNILPNICPPPSAFLGPKCALWDCFRPAQGSNWCLDYCSSGHAVLALNEGLPGMTPILRPGGICLKDGPLFAALNSKAWGKEVGVPICEGAANTKSPWNAPGRPTSVHPFHLVFVFLLDFLFAFSYITSHIHFAVCLLNQFEKDILLCGSDSFEKDSLHI